MSTLIQELEQAAHAFSLLADKADGYTRSECDTFAARLRKRIEHIRGMGEARDGSGPSGQWCSGWNVAFDGLTGDL